MIDEIAAVVRAQGAFVDRSEFDQLVVVKRWSQPCFEYAHFTDEEIASALWAAHPTCNGLTLKSLIDAVAEARSRGGDVKRVWETRGREWRPKPSKTALAEELWPYLSGRIAAVYEDPTNPLPEVAQRMLEVYNLAGQVWPGRYLLKRTSESASEKN